MIQSYPFISTSFISTSRLCRQKCKVPVPWSTFTIKLSCLYRRRDKRKTFMSTETLGPSLNKSFVFKTFISTSCQLKQKLCSTITWSCRQTTILLSNRSCGPAASSDPCFVWTIFWSCRHAMVKFHCLVHIDQPPVPTHTLLTISWSCRQF
jgi:hypothetical protein